jgi:outer membrane protein, multidrug efflux system
MRAIMRRSFAAAILSCFALAGAAHGQEADAPNVPVAEVPLPGVDDPMLEPVGRARVEVSTWSDALRHVRARSNDLRIAAQEILRAEAQSRVALAGALPQINATGAYTHNLITNPTLQPVRTGTELTFRPVRTPFPDFLTGSIVGVQPLFAPRAWWAIGTADRGVDVARLSLEDVKRRISLAVASSIVAVVTAERVAELNRLGLQNALTRLELTMRRAALGGGTGLDVVRARQDVEVARATLVQGDEDLRQSREALGLALGIPEQVGVPPDVDISGLESDARSACRIAPSVEERPDVATLRAQTEVADRGVRDVSYQFLPTVDLRSSMSTTTIDTGAAPNTTWNVQAVLTVPIWDGGARYGFRRDAHAQTAIARERAVAQWRQANVEVTQARRAVGVAGDRQRVAQQARDLAAENDRLTRASYAEGRGTSFELVQTAQQLRTAEIELAVRDFDLVRARVLAVLALATCPW